MEPWILTPINRTHLVQKEEAYNRCLKKTRFLSEQCNGLLKMRFRCLTRQRILMYSPERAGKIINSCIVLHNIMISHRIPYNPDEIELEEQVPAADDENILNLNDLLAEGRRVQEQLINEHF